MCAIRAHTVYIFTRIDDSFHKTIFSLVQCNYRDSIVCSEKSEEKNGLSECETRLIKIKPKQIDFAQIKSKCIRFGICVQHTFAHIPMTYVEHVTKW